MKKSFRQTTLILAEVPAYSLAFKNKFWILLLFGLLGNHYREFGQLGIIRLLDISLQKL